MSSAGGQSNAGRPSADGAFAHVERLAKFRRLIDLMESHLDSGFFLSMVGKILVDEKKLYSLLSELRAVQFEMESDAKGASGAARTQAAGQGAPRTDGISAAEVTSLQSCLKDTPAGRLDPEVLDNIDQTLQKMMVALKDMQEILQQRLTREVKQDGSAKI
jgi:hypothetical protein